MNEQDFSKYVKDRYNGQLQWYDQKSISNKKNYDVFQTFIIICSSLTPVLIVILEPDWKALAVVTSVIVAIFTGFVTTFKMREKWLAYRKMAEAMRKEHQFYKTSAGIYATVNDRETLFVERIESLISNENEDWWEIQKK